jgi:hypothetical protein
MGEDLEKERGWLKNPQTVIPRAGEEPLIF